MPIYRETAEGKFVPFEHVPFPDLEKVLEDWIEKNPHLVFEGERLAVVSRQPRTAFQKQLDLLAVDRTGAMVIIELKRGQAPRDVVAQALEYAAWVATLSVSDLDNLAERYAESTGTDHRSIAEIYDSVFSDEIEIGEEGDALSERITFNHCQRIAIVAEKFPDEVEQTMRYLRTSYAADIVGVTFSVHTADGQRLVNTTTVVGRETAVSSQVPSRVSSSSGESDEELVKRVKTEFMRAAVSGIEEWVDASGYAELTVDHSSGSEHYLRFQGKTWIYYYYATRWLYMLLYGPSESEIDRLKSGLSTPDSLKTGDGWDGWRFRVTNESDLDVVKSIVLDRTHG